RARDHRQRGRRRPLTTRPQGPADGRALATCEDFDMTRDQPPIERHGLLPLSDLLSQVEGLDWYTEDTGDTPVILIRLPAGGLLGVTRGSARVDAGSPDGWLACHYDDPGEMWEGGGRLLL